MSFILKNRSKKWNEMHNCMYLKTDKIKQFSVVVDLHCLKKYPKILGFYLERDA